jgi:tRNA threonylcarbamoyladenosine biosynthesis protein TsaB
MELAIDTASDVAGLALTESGRLLAEYTWQAQRQHSRDLLPAIDMLLERAGGSKRDLTAVFVSTGPGSYAGVRVGLSVAKGLAFALGIPIVGVGRLEVEAYQHAAYPGPVCAVHQAGKKDLAWAVYEGPAADWHEVSGPVLTRNETFVGDSPPDALFCGEIEGIQEDLKAAGRRLTAPMASLRRAGFLAELGYRRLEAGQVDEVRALAPIYMREPAIGPQSN